MRDDASKTAKGDYGDGGGVQENTQEQPIVRNNGSKSDNRQSTIVNPPSLPPARGFSHGILVSGGSLLFLAGQTATNADGQIVAPGDVVGQYEQVLRNLQAVVAAAGGNMGDIVKLTIFVRDRDGYKAHLRPLGRVHHAFFGAYYPALALFEISRFFEDEVLVEVEGIAVIGTRAAE